MIRSAIAAMIAAALAAAPAYAQTQGQPQTPSPNYPYQEVERPPAGEVIRDVVQDAVDALPPGPERRGGESVSGASANGSSGSASKRRSRRPIPEPPVAVAPPLPEPIVSARPRAQSRARAGTGPADADKARYAKTGRSDRARRFAASEACAARDGAASRGRTASGRRPRPDGDRDWRSAFGSARSGGAAATAARVEDLSGRCGRRGIGRLPGEAPQPLVAARFARPRRGRGRRRMVGPATPRPPRSDPRSLIARAAARSAGGHIVDEPDKARRAAGLDPNAPRVQLMAVKMSDLLPERLDRVADEARKTLSQNEDIGCMKLAWDYVGTELENALKSALDCDAFTVFAKTWATAQQLSDYADPAKHPPGERSVIELGAHEISRALEPVIAVTIGSCPCIELKFTFTVTGNFGGVALGRAQRAHYRRKARRRLGHGPAQLQRNPASRGRRIAQARSCRERSISPSPGSRFRGSLRKARRRGTSVRTGG